MKILITGATGLIGKEIGKKLFKEGHELVVLTRNVKQTRGQLPFPAKILPWKDSSEPLPPEYFDGVDSVIHLAGESIAAARWSKKQKQLILKTRIESTRGLVEAIKSSTKTVRQFISASAIGIYGNNLNEVDENSPKAKDFLGEVCKNWEQEAQALSAVGIKVINPRIGIVLSRKGGALDKMIPLFSAGLGGVVGNGSQWMSWIHQEDLTNMFAFFVSHPELEGPFNAVAPNPATNKDFSKELAGALGRSLFFPVPAIVLKLALGEMSTLVVDGQKVSNKKIMNAGFTFKFASLNSALKELCSPLLECQNEIVAEVWLPKPASDVFPFFCDEKNLEKLTPEYLNFHVLKKSSSEIQEGTIIDYKLKLRGFPMRWRTLIEKWVPGKVFVDTQLKGPYKLWHHTHEFEDIAGGTLMRDRVLYKLPLGRIGHLITGSFVRADVNKIFSHRSKVIADLFK